MSTSWRIVKARHAATAFDGEGARISGGRWNSPGTRMVYTSETASLATLEMLVHLGRSRTLPQYAVFACDFDERLVETLDWSSLPADWHSYPAPGELAELGDRWIRAGTSAILRVPSAVVDTESDYLLNPAHRDFRRIRVSDAQPFTLDLRLIH